MTPRLQDEQSSDERSVDCMNHEDPNDGKQTADGVRFIQTLFDPDDTILARPIEIWTDAGKKQSRADHQGTWYGRGGERLGDGEWDWIPAGSPASLDTRLGRIKARSGQERTNIFFGVCPRHGSQHFDQAWQIRKVRCLWADIDHVTVEEALERCRAAGLPQPSIVVNSGNGVHLYWLLVEPYLIDDAGGDPIPVYTEFEDQGPAKKKKPRKYIIDPTTQERLYLDVKANVPPLSRKAQFVQDVLAGLASKIGGDHTTDLSRLLRIPGTKNRKDQRNGREPVPCTLIECDPSRRYPIEQFAQFVESSPQKAHRETVAKVKLPAPRKLSPKGTDKFNELVLACSTAPVGTRSEADFALCCWSVEHGVSREDVRTAVAGIGKFAERPDYFDRTWNAAEQNTRENILAKVHGGQVGKAPLSNHDAPAGDDDGIGAKDDRIRGLADAICAQHQFAQDSSGCLYRFEKGVYKPTGKELVKRLVKQLCLEFNATADWSPSLANAVVEFIRVDSPLLWEQPPLDVLNVKNGLLRLSDRVLVPHSPDHLSPVQLPVEFDPSATCPAIEAFVNSLGGGAVSRGGCAVLCEADRCPRRRRGLGLLVRGCQGRRSAGVARGSENPSNSERSPMIVFFDTETIGTPDNYRAPMSDTANWPRMVELAWGISQDGETLEGQHARLIQPDGWAIPPEAEAIHGITTEDCQIHGMLVSEVLAEFLGVTSRAALLVGHNIEFDLAIVGAEFYRIGLGDVADLMAGQLRYCTMRSGVVSS